ncbi:D-tyrosyl-tRNA(Tyr) deacylase [Patescibacteria group bacterium]|nr:D-tyrosyl-tRNA(Tyr) deacylase [Patescibacteria group bacterium]
MRILIQKVESASIFINKQKISQIDSGLLIFVGIDEQDDKSDIDTAVSLITQNRLIPDENGKFCFSLKDKNQPLLVIPQFTLCAQFSGKKPNFLKAKKPALAIKIFDNLVSSLISQKTTVVTGKFGAYMKVHCINDGPVNFYFDTKL